MHGREVGASSAGGVVTGAVVPGVVETAAGVVPDGVGDVVWPRAVWECRGRSVRGRPAVRGCRQGPACT
ncbi:hypothetical protein [Nonomuraea dietziae]|uniref:hypothetical protein n=1 Tax=Nonomuraea dietziae TaxID=65515 RepID=UPI0031DA22C9